MQLSGIFQIADWQETVTKEFDDDTKLNMAIVQQTYSGDIIGSSEVRYQMHYATQTDASFNGYEFITCTIDKQACKLVLKHDGNFKNGIASSQFMIIASKPINNLEGKTGYFESTEGGKAKYQIG